MYIDTYTFTFQRNVNALIKNPNILNFSVKEEYTFNFHTLISTKYPKAHAVNPLQ